MLLFSHLFLYFAKVCVQVFALPFSLIGFFGVLIFCFFCTAFLCQICLSKNSSAAPWLMFWFCPFHWHQEALVMVVGIGSYCIGWHETYRVDQTGLAIIEIHLPLLPKHWDCKCVPACLGRGRSPQTHPVCSFVDHAFGVLFKKWPPCLVSGHLVIPL